MSTALDQFLPGQRAALAPIGSAFSVTLGKMLDAGRAVEDSHTPLPYIRAANIQDEGLRLTDVNEMPFSVAEARRLDLREGDLLVVEGGAVGTCVVLDHNMPGWSFQKTVNRLRPTSDWSTRYLAYVLRSYRDAGIIGLICDGSTISHLTAEKLRALRVPAIQPETQRAIADFLDCETNQIDALVAKQNELIALLRERRNVAVSKILSRAQQGENPPDKLHRRTRMGNGSTPRSGEDRYWLDGEIPWVNSSVVNLPEVHEPSRYVTKTAVLECHLPLVRPGSILVALTGQGKTRGTATILRIESTINQHLAYIEPDERYWVPEYLLGVAL